MRDIIIGVLLIPTLFYSGVQADSKPVWKMLMLYYIILIIFMTIYSMKNESIYNEDYLKLIGFIGCNFAFLLIYIQVIIMTVNNCRT
jgi:hypothetical protein